MNTKLSVIIPCYNCSKTLVEAVDSVISQSLKVLYEIVLVDDRSTDGTREIMQKLAEEHKEIKLFYHETNRGGGATRNTAVEKSLSEDIFCLDSDDLLPAGTLQKMYDYLLLKGCDGVAINRSVKFIGNDINNIDRVEISNYLDKEIPFSSLLSKEEFNPLCVNFMFTKGAFRTAGGYPTAHGFDTQGFAWRFLCAGLRAFTCPDTEYLHRTNFHDSYYSREYNSGNYNFNYRNILLEHYYVLNDKALKFIREFDCADFTRNIMMELTDLDDILASGLEDKLHVKHLPLVEQDIIYNPVKRNSLRGYFYRIRHKLGLILHYSKGVRPNSKMTINNGKTPSIGAYYQCFKRPEAVIFVLREFRRHYPNSDIFLLNDGGYNYTHLAKQFNCKYKHETKNIGNGVAGILNSREKLLDLTSRWIEAARNIKEDNILILEDDVFVMNRISKEMKYSLNGIPNPKSYLGAKMTQFLKFKNRTIPFWILRQPFSCFGGTIVRKADIIKYLSHDIKKDLDKLVNYEKKPISNFAADKWLSILMLYNGATIGQYEGLCETHSPEYKNRLAKGDISVLHQYKITYGKPLTKSDLELLGDYIN